MKKSNTNKNNIQKTPSPSTDSRNTIKKAGTAALLSSKSMTKSSSTPNVDDNYPSSRAMPQSSAPRGTRVDKLAGLPLVEDIVATIAQHATLFKRPLNTLALAQELDVPPTKVSGLQTVVERLAGEGRIKISPRGLLSSVDSTIPEKKSTSSKHKKSPIQANPKSVAVSTASVVSNHSQPLAKSPDNTLQGVIQVHRDGYGFVNVGEGEDVFVNERNLNGAWNGDAVAVRLLNSTRGAGSGKREGEVAQVVERKHSRVVAHLLRENGVWLAAPDDVRLNSDILIDERDLMGARAQQVVMVALKDYGSPHVMPSGRVIEVLGNADDAGMEIEIAVRKFDIPHVFSPETEQQVAALPDAVSGNDWQGRVDLRDVPLVTIDGEDARDFDDAVYCEPVRQGRKVVAYRLLVAIADVSHYVKDKTPLNVDAIARATSVYFPRRVVPMLPEKLSNGLCSLNPHVDRLCMVADMVIDTAGEVTAYQFYPAVMYSAARLTYNQVWEYLSEKTGVLTAEYSTVAPHIGDLYDLFKVLLAAREQRGAMEFETTETYIVADQAGKIQEILPRTRNDAHRLIEECMLCANVCAAEFIAQSDRMSLYRVHQGPTPEKLESLRQQLRLVGLVLGGGDKPTPKDYAHVAQQIDGRPDAQVLQTLLLRSMQQAVYSPDNLGHFGLAYPAYTHFTSPIRRYPDLLVHRTIKAILQGQRYMPQVDGLNLLKDTRKKISVVDEAMRHVAPKSVANDGKHAVWQALGEHSSMCERRADEASRDVTAWLKCEYVKQFVGQEMDGHISSVTAFGAFVTLDAVYVDGLVHISELGKDYFEFDEASLALRGQRSGVIYRLGDAIKIQIANVNSDTRKIDFVLATNKTDEDKTNVSVAENKTKKRRKRD